VQLRLSLNASYILKMRRKVKRLNYVFFPFFEMFGEVISRTLENSSKTYPLLQMRYVAIYYEL